MSAEWVKQLKQAKQQLDERQATKALSTITALLHSLASSSSSSSDKERKKLLELHYQSLLLSGLIQQRLHRLPLALQAYTQATQLQPDAPAAYKALHELHSTLTRDDDAILALYPALLPAMQHTPDNKRIAYIVHISQLLLERGRWKEARRLLFPLLGLSAQTEDVVEDGPAVDGRVFLPPAFFRLCFGLFLQLDDEERAKELGVRLERQLRKLRDRREEEKMARERVEAKRQQLQKQREGKVTVPQVAKEERERQAKQERDEEEDVRRKVTAKLHADWLQKQDNERRLQRLHDWAEGYGMMCDEACKHREEEAWVKRKVERMTIAASAEEYAQLRAAVIVALTDMSKTHPRSTWCREQLTGMQMDLWEKEQGEDGQSALLRSLRYAPTSTTLHQALALRVCGPDEDSAQAARDAVVRLLIQQHPPQAVFPPSLSTAHFWARYLVTYSMLRSATATNHLASCAQAIQTTLADLTTYQTEHPYHPLTGCAIALQLLHADVLVCGRDEQSADEAAATYSTFVEDARLGVRRSAAFGLMKAAVLRRSMEPARALTQLKRWREAGGANATAVAWLSAYVHFTRHQQEMTLRRETVQHLTQQQRADRRTKDHALLQQLLEALAHAQPSFPVLLLKGKVMWALGGEYRSSRERAYEAFVTALSRHAASASSPLSPFSMSSILLSHSDCFAYLGLYTQHVLHLPLKARLFYQKTLAIQPHNPTAGPALALLLTQAEQDSQLLSLFASAVRSDSRCRWAYLLSARYHVQHGMAQQGIAQYQHALRSEGKGGAVWSELGGAYFIVGSFIAALRCWKRAVELNGEDDAALYGIAQVWLMLHMHSQAIDLLHSTLATYQALPPDEPADSPDPVLHEDSPPRSPPVIAVTRLLADVYYSLAIVQCKTGAYTAAIAAIASCIHTALSCLTLITASPSPSHLAGSYKALGDAHFLYAQLPVDSSSDLVLHVTDGQPPSKEKLRLLLLADRYFAKAIQLHPTIPSLWYDRGVTNRQLSLLASSTTLTSPSPYHERATACLKHAVRLAPNNSFHWLGLSTILPSFSARHHSLVQAIRAQKNPTAWAHLSLFYLEHGGGTLTTPLPAHSKGPPTVEQTSIGDGSAFAHLDAARLSLQLAQTMDPLHPAVWLAQGLFNSSFEEVDVLANAAGCFGRSVELGSTYNARVGLAWCSVRVEDWLTAAYGARKLVEQWPEKSAGWNLHGACCEWQGRHAEAEFAFHTAEQLVAVESLPVRTADPQREPEAEERARRLLLRLIRVNRAQALCGLARHAGSIVLAQAILQEDAELGIAPASAASLYQYHLLVEVYTKGGQYEEGRRVVVAAMELITQARAELGEDEEAEAQVRQLAGDYHRFFVHFVQLLLYEGKDEEALHHLQGRVQQEVDGAGDISAASQRRLELLRLTLSVGVKRKDPGLLQYAVDAMTETTLQQLDTSSPSSHAGLLRSLYASAVTAALAQGDVAAAKRAHLKAIAVEPTSTDAWTAFFAFHMLHLPSLTPAILPLITPPHLQELRFRQQSSIIERLRVVAEAYILTNRFSPSTASLSLAYEQEEAANRAGEEQQLMTRSSAEEAAAEDDADDGSTGEEVEEKVDDNVRHEQPIDPALARLAAASSSSFAFDESLAPPSSQHAVSAAARLVLLDPTAREHWAVLASAAEGREQDRWRQGVDSEGGWGAVVSCSVHQSLLSQQPRLSHLSPLDVPAAQEEATQSSLLALLRSVRATSHLEAEAGREERLRYLQHSMALVPQERLTSPSLLWHFHRCAARVSLFQLDIDAALTAFQCCIDLASSNPSPSLPLPQAIIWEEVADALHSDDAAVAALQSGLSLLDDLHRSHQQPEQPRSCLIHYEGERLQLLLALLSAHQRSGRWQAGLALLQSERAFLASLPSPSALHTQLLLCDWMDWAAAPRAEWRAEAKRLSALCAGGELEQSSRQCHGWEQPLPARTRMHLAQLDCERQHWTAAYEQLQEEQRLHPSSAAEPAFIRMLEDVQRRIREQPPAVSSSAP